MGEKEDIQYYHVAGMAPSPEEGYFRCSGVRVEKWDPGHDAWDASNLERHELEEYGARVDWTKLPNAIRKVEDRLPANEELMDLQEKLRDEACELRRLHGLLSSSVDGDIIRRVFSECVDSMEETASLVCYAKNSIPAGGPYSFEQSTEGAKE